MPIVTALQAAMLKKIARSEYSELNGAEPENVSDIGWVWADTIIETAEDKGVFTTLLQRGFVKHSGGKKDAGVTLTEGGFSAYKTL